MKYKFVAADFDDTLLRSDYTLSERTLNTIRKYVQKGGVFTVATGRMYTSIARYLNVLDVSAPIICYQGGLIADQKTGEILRKSVMSNDLALRLLHELEGRGMYIQMYYDDVLYVKQKTAYTLKYERTNRIQAVETNEPLSEFARRNQVEPTKLLVIEDPVALKRISDEVRAAFATEVLVNLTKPYFMEIASNRASKATAIQFLLDRYGFTKEECIAVGDSMNDVSMIEFAGLGVAMGNAFDEVKKIANYVTLTNDEDGVAEVIEKFCLEESNE